MSDLNLDYLAEARHLVGEYFETDPPMPKTRLLEIAAIALVSIAESLRIIAEETEEITEGD